MTLPAILKDFGRRTKGHWAALPKVMATRVSKVLFSHTRTEGSQGRRVPRPRGLLWQVNGTWVGHLHTGAATPLLGNLYPDLSIPC